jgi:hypothetical protein|uniref:Uncharacterized protein n=1 Tax=viral metagenome TaxID=1070528 RepID=A0A6C0BDK3_9ZZZZ
MNELFYVSKLQKYKNYKCISDTVILNNTKKLVLSFYDEKNVLLIRTHALYIGSYSLEMNYWIWGNESNIIDKYLKKQIEEYRNNLQKNDDKNVKTFSINNSVIIPFNELNDMLKTIDIQNIFIHTLSKKLDVYVIEKKLYSSIQ